MKFGASVRKAASVILIRPVFSKQATAGRSFEILLGLRNKKSKFAPGAYVFPGGALEQDDANLALFYKDKQRHSEPRGEPDIAELAAKIAAIRECFEEMGIILASEGDGIEISASTRERLLSYRRRALAGEADVFPELLKKEGLVPASPSLHFFARWVTPPFFPTRYDALFFVALLPEGQEAHHDGNEFVAHKWLLPAAILVEHSQGDFPLLHPTLMSIRALATYHSAEELIGKLKMGIIPVWSPQERLPDFLRKK